MKRGPKIKMISNRKIGKVCQLIRQHVTLTKALKYTHIEWRIFYNRLTPRQARQIDEAKALTLTKGAWTAMLYHH